MPLETDRAWWWNPAPAILPPGVRVAAPEIDPGRANGNGARWPFPGRTRPNPWPDPETAILGHPGPAARDTADPAPELGRLRRELVRGDRRRPGPGAVDGPVRGDGAYGVKELT